MVNDRMIDDRVGLRLLMAQAAAWAVKQERQGQYRSAFCVADAVMEEGAEIMEHRETIEGFMSLGQALYDSMYQTSVEQEENKT